MQKSRVLVIGGGPAGAVAAYFIAKNGIDVTLLDKDKWPREKICGGGLTTNCLPILDKMALTKEVDANADFKFDGYIIHAPSGEKVEAPVRKRDGVTSKKVPYSYIINRKTFDYLLLEKAKEAGTRVFTEVEAAKVETGPPIKVFTKQGTTYECEVLVVADGSGSSITRQFVKDVHEGSAIAIKGIYSGVKGLSGKMEFFLDDDVGFGYGWFFPMGGDKANVGIGLDIAYLKRRKINIRQLLADMIEKPIIKPRMAEAKLESELQTFPLRMGYDKSAFRQDRVLFAGDAAKLVYPLSGEGISYAMQCGEIAAKAISNVYSDGQADFRQLKSYEIECWQAFADFKPASKLQRLMGHPRVQQFFFKNSVYDDELGQKAIGILEHTSDVGTFFNFRTLAESFYIAIKRRIGI